MNKQRIRQTATVTMPVSVTCNGGVKEPNDVTVRRNGLRYRGRLLSPLLIFPYLLLIAFILSDGKNAYAQSDLKSGVPDLCYQCHKKLKEKLSSSHVHFPFKQGKCLNCHSAHASDLNVLMKDDTNALCLSCHEGIRNLIKKGTEHGALKKGVCTDCHYGHGGENKYLLIREEKELCWECHRPMQEQLKQSYIHLPFKEGECSSCHNAHASSEEDLLSAAPNKICKNCHPARCNVSNVSITFATKDLDCSTCHSGHSSNTKGLLGPYGHTVFLNKNCDQCHNSIVSDKKITTKLSGKDLCFTCHPKGSISYREGDVHGTGKTGCAMCHNYHASKKKTLTLKEEGVCYTCHQDIEKKQNLMIKALKSIRCIPIRDRKCFECHVPLHSQNPLYFKGDKISTCVECHKAQHSISHPMGKEAMDPRNGQPITCITCHNMHSAKADFMLYFDRKRALCIQCHKR